MFTLARFRRLVLRPSAESWSIPPGPGGCERGGPPPSPLGDALSFFFTSAGTGPAGPGTGPAGASSERSTPLPPEEEEEEEGAESFLLESMMEEDSGLSWKDRQTDREKIQN